MAGLSYIHNPGSKPLLYRTIPDLLTESVERKTYEAFVHHKSDGTRESITNKDLKMKSEKFAGYLVDKVSVKPGERIAICGPNSINWIIGEMGVIMAGGVAVHLSIGQTDAADIIEIMHMAEFRTLLFDTNNYEEYRKILSHLQVSKSGVTNVILLQDDKTFGTFPNIDAIMETYSVDIILPHLQPENSVAVFTTSGSTGKPKMVQHTHFPFTNFDGDEFYPRQDKACRTTIFNDRPFAWVGGSPLLDITRDMRRIFADTAVSVSGFSTERTWNIIRTESCDTALLLPYFLQDLLDLKEVLNSDFKLSMVLTGGQIINSKYLKVIGVYTDALRMAYGSTEAFGVSYIDIKDASQVELEGSTEKLFENVEVKVVDGSGVTRMEEIGEIYVRSPFLSIGFLNNEEANKEAFTETGWLRTGDIGYISDGGYIVIKGRMSDVISRGTRKIIPHSIEDKVLEMNGVYQVAVIAVPDGRLYEEVCVCFVSDTDVNEEDVKGYCETKFLTKETLDGLGEMPKYFVKFGEFSKLPNGKMNKGQLKDEALKRLRNDA